MHAMAWHTAFLSVILQELGMLAVTGLMLIANRGPIMHVRLCQQTLLHATRHECPLRAGQESVSSWQ